jgi:hypothetical protein
MNTGLEPKSEMLQCLDLILNDSRKPSHPVLLSTIRHLEYLCRVPGDAAGAG